jgi:hypothetical protein
MPVKHVAHLLGLHWHTVKTIDQQRLAREVFARRLRRGEYETLVEWPEAWLAELRLWRGGSR